MWRSRLISPRTLTAFIVGVFLIFTPFWFFLSARSSSVPARNPRPRDGSSQTQKPLLDTSIYHPIDKLRFYADDEFDEILSKQTSGVAAAATRYRKVRGRHPPPGFDKWVEYAESHNTVMVEEFWDHIYSDLEPFWATSPLFIREQANDWDAILSIRDGKLYKRMHPTSKISGDWMDHWRDMINNIAEFLPDVDMPFNDIDESRVAVPWEEIERYMEKAEMSKTTALPLTGRRTISEFDKMPMFNENQEFNRLDWHGARWENPISYWMLLRETCPPDSPARQLEVDKDLESSPKFPRGYPKNSLHGYVMNWTDSKYLCSHPQLRNMYGNFIRPRYNSQNATLRPLFSGCKISGMNNEILVPAAKYYSKQERFAFDGHYVDWNAKIDGLYWRGQASGGAHNISNWKRYHRMRMLAMLNGTFVDLEERSRDNRRAQLTAGVPESAIKENVRLPHIFPLPDPRWWDLAALTSIPTTLGKWMEPLANTGFNHFMCNPWDWGLLNEGHQCRYLTPWFTPQSTSAFMDQFQYKYLLDIDGNSYSGRFRAQMLSQSLPIKATIWAEWHDQRLVPWRHFVPMHSSYVDFWGLLEYFIGYKGVAKDDSEIKVQAKERPGHDQIARQIAQEGKDWANKVLREEDMFVYVYRLVLEYARICSDRRGLMGYTDDLI